MLEKKLNYKSQQTWLIVLKNFVSSIFYKVKTV